MKVHYGHSTWGTFFKTTRRRTNMSFLRTLKKEFGRRQFTTTQAQDVYVERHCEHSPTTSRPASRHPEYSSASGLEGVRRDPSWKWMSARNVLYGAVDLGLLIRVRRGVYRFI